MGMGVDSTEGDEYLNADDGKGIEWEGQYMCALLNKFWTLIKLHKSS